MPATELVVLDGSTFFVSDRKGDVEASAADGFFYEDVRHLTLWRLLVDGAPMRLLTTRTIDYYSARVFGTLAGESPRSDAPLAIRRDRTVAEGVREEIVIESYSHEEFRVRLEILFGADFADFFEVTRSLERRGKTWTEVEEGRVTLWFERDGYRRGTAIDFSAPCELDDRRALFEVSLPPRGRWQTSVDVTPLVEQTARPPRGRGLEAGEADSLKAMTLEQWFENAPKLETDWDVLRHTYRQSLLDLASLRLRPREDLRWSLPAAGVPWFMALFGRDTIIAAFETLPFQPQLARTTLEALADLQASEYDDDRDSEPGKILHELRRGTLAALGEIPHSPYYGSHDATLLFPHPPRRV